MKFHEIKCHNALNKLKRKIPYSWDLNIYRGCAHGCRYCYAIYSHEYIGIDNFFDDIYIKTNIIDKLEKELSSPNWKREIINIAATITTTDEFLQRKVIFTMFYLARFI